MTFDQCDVVKALDFERLGGSEGERRGMDVLTGYITDAGLEYSVHPFQLYGFDTGSATVDVSGNSFSVHPYGLSSSGTITGELCFLENADILAYNVGAFRDKIIMSYTTSRRIADLLSEARAAAYIGVSAPLKGNFSFSHRQKAYADGSTIPSVTVSYEDAQRLIRLSGKEATLYIDQDPEVRVAHNIVVSAGVPARDETLTYLVGHYDTVSRSHGSIDNAGGTANLVKACYHFAENPPEREIKIIFFSAEELGLRGSFAYVRDNEEEVRNRGRLVVNVDLSGDPIGQDKINVLGTRELLGYAGGITRENGLMFAEALDIYSSDCMPFAVHEVPSVNVLRTGGSGIHYIHTKDDVANNVTPRGLENTYLAAVSILDRVLSSEIYPVKRTIDSSLKDKIERYLWQSLCEKPELKWKESYKR